MRLLSSFLAFVVLAMGVFFAYGYFESKYPLIIEDGEYAKQISTQLLEYFLIASVVASLLLSLLIFSVLSTRDSARRLAYRISKDISFSKEQFRRFYSLSPVPYLLLDEKGQITRPNKATLRFFGKVEEDLLGKDLFSFFVDPDNQKNIAQYREKVKRRMPLEKIELQVQLPSKELRWVLLSIEDISTPGFGNHSGLVTMVDIHEQKELERIKTEFLSLASHQLRSPLSNLRWYIDFLLNRRREQMSEEVQDYLHKMYRRNSDMIELVNTLLNLSRIEMGRIKIEKEETNVGEIVASVVEELETEAQEKGITLETSYSGDAVMNTDRRLVRIILQNLLSNALRYTMQGGKVQFRLLATPKKVRFEVEDTGVGIPPDEQGSIFAKLYRATNAKAVEANGNGIGLYMCKELVENMGGEISFTSKMGEGTTFFVDLLK